MLFGYTFYTLIDPFHYKIIVILFLEKVAGFRKEIQEEENLSKNMKAKKK